MKKEMPKLCDRPVANIARLQSRQIDTYHGNGNTEEYTNAGVLFGYTGKAYDNFSKLYNYGFRDLSVIRKQWPLLFIHVIAALVPPCIAAYTGKICDGLN